eukprot:364263-Chlamydomonas_euryale.AAC.12
MLPAAPAAAPSRGWRAVQVRAGHGVTDLRVSWWSPLLRCGQHRSSRPLLSGAFDRLRVPAPPAASARHLPFKDIYPSKTSASGRASHAVGLTAEWLSENLHADHIAFNACLSRAATSGDRCRPRLARSVKGIALPDQSVGVCNVAQRLALRISQTARRSRAVAHELKERAEFRSPLTNHAALIPSHPATRAPAAL